MQQKSHVCRWNRSHVRGHVKLVRAASSYNTVESRKTKEGSNLNINATNPFVFYSRKHLRKILALIPLLGNVAWKTKIFLYVHQDQSSRCNYEGRVGSTYPCRSLSGSVKNAVDGVVLAAIQIADDPSTEATVPPRSSHVRLGDVSSFLIQQGVEERLMENRQHDGVVVMV